MSVQIHSWEHRLLSLAHEAAQAATSIPSRPVSHRVLSDAYAHCEAITAEHSRSFHMASALLPPRKRLAARALYAFCRVSDDIVDDPTADPQAALSAWQKAILSDRPSSDDPVAIAWNHTRAEYNIPQLYAEQLIDGVARDLYQDRYETFDELAAYAYGVASTVGLMSMHIIGFAGKEAIPYAIKLGVALQLTNILRDVGEDWHNGRVYLPQADLKMFNLSEADLAAGAVDNRWRNFMRFQISRNRRLYREAWPGIGMLNEDGRFAIAAAARLYEGILSDIEANDYDVFNRRAHVTKWGKLRMLPRIWWESRTVAQ